MLTASSEFDVRCVALGTVLLGPELARQMAQQEASAGRFELGR